MPGAPVGFKSWWGQQYMVGRISPLNGPGLSRVKVAAKTWRGHVPMSKCPQARLHAYIQLRVS